MPENLNPDGTRKFEGLQKLKLNRQTRHIQRLDAFSKWLDNIAEELEQRLLNLSRDVREKIENVDVLLCKKYANLKDDTFMTGQSEENVFGLLDELTSIVSNRAELIEIFARDLDDIELYRADTVSSELKKLTDDLILVAHQLPDEIEHILESESFDLNTVLTANRKAHLELLGMMRKTQIESDVEAVQLWEDARMRWRQLRHDKALGDFSLDLNSKRFSDPDDRRVLMDQVRAEQRERQNRRNDLLKQLGTLDANNINTEFIVNIQQKFTVISEQEVEAIQSCYNSLVKFKENLHEMALVRVEELRKELHSYGALHLEPPLKRLSETFAAAIQDSSMSELWRLGGGLKPEINSMCSEFISPNIVYNNLVDDLRCRLEIITSSFNLKIVLEERGRIMTLDRVRSLLIKLRNAPKNELPDIVTGLLGDLEEIGSVEKMNSVFRGVIRDCVDEMKAELARVALVATRRSIAGDDSDDIQSSVTGKSSRAATSKMNASEAKTSKSGKHTALASSMTEAEKGLHVDPIAIKSWCRRLGVLYYGSDLPEIYRTACIEACESMSEQRICNDLVDEVVKNISTKKMQVMDRKFKRLIDTITSFMELQASSTSLCAANLTDYYIQLSKSVELHRSTQKALDDKSMDELWDWKEDFRLMLEEKEGEIEKQCIKVKQSNSHEEIQEQFAVVLRMLDDIQESYRGYHAKACFLADKYPLSLANEFMTHLLSICSQMLMIPKRPHHILTHFDRLLSETMRLNLQFLDANEGINIVGSINYEKKTETEDSYVNAMNHIGHIDSNLDEEKQAFPDYTSIHGRSEVWNVNVSSGSPKQSGSGSGHGSSGSTFDIASIAGIYSVKLDISGIIQTFLNEKPETAADFSGGNSTDASPVEPSHGIVHIEKKGHEDYPWIINTFTVLSPDELLVLEDEEGKEGLFEYHVKLAKAFTPLDDSILSGMTEQQIAAYEATKVAVDETVRQLNAPVSCPCDDTGNPWVFSIELNSDTLLDIMCDLRDSLISCLEIEAHERVLAAGKTCKGNKAQFTEELEDRIRTHWPRRGRVETQIKQPREAELLSHQEKTWRHIESIQSKMISLQSKFKASIVAGKEACDQYINEVVVNRSALTTTTWKTLATLQAVDAKVRNFTINFQVACSKHSKILQEMVVDDIAASINYATQFMKLCPPQEVGKEGGYSESEIQEIEELIKGQCDEIQLVQDDWNVELNALKEQQEQSLKTIDSFSVQYERSALELALSEGLGQKYGAPRRRAQERLRTEISRDEQSAGKIDELLAKLDFFCTEEKTASTSNGDDMVIPESSESVEVSSGIAGENDITRTHEVWNLLLKVRQAMRRRVEYLQVSADSSSSSAPIELPWLETTREKITLKPRALPDDDTFHHTLSSGMLKAFFEDMDKCCRTETKQLYESEGRADALGSNGIPDSLQKWLLDKKDKLLGPGGYHEKAWKRLWAQIERLELILCRKIFETDEEEENANNSRMSAVALAIRSLGKAYIENLNQERVEMDKKFRKLLIVLEKGREKNERLLRPRLGSPDAADELTELDNAEGERSGDLINAVHSFEDTVARRHIDIAKCFMEDVGLVYKSGIQYLDSSLRLDSIALPPDTIMPKPKLTLKRLRKAQRIRQEVAASGGGEDRSKVRTWPSIPVDSLLSVLTEAEGLVDPSKTTRPPPPVQEVPAPAAKGVKVPKGAAVAPPADAIADEKPSLIPSSWLTSLAANTCVHGKVTTGHRAVVKERDLTVEFFMNNMKAALQDIQVFYGKILQQEKSWNERWRRQVDSLRNGVV